MGVVRLHLHLITLVIVLLQVSIPVFASAALCCKAKVEATHGTTPCCHEGNEAACPMHEQHADPQSSDDDTFRAACQLDHKLFELLLGTSAVIPPAEPITPPPAGVLNSQRPTTGSPLWLASAALPPPKA